MTLKAQDTSLYNSRVFFARNPCSYDTQKMNGKYQVGLGRVVTVTLDTPSIIGNVPHEESEVKS